ncbi:MAG: hypothetical protein E6G92_00400 [Alphaproteobacteria bacterium]|nr:MAG: hypothetical protein E6G92_00400 [Alphaproteobacteria bacterium]
MRLLELDLHPSAGAGCGVGFLVLCHQPSLVIPAKAGIQLLPSALAKGSWIPAFAGMTKKE